MKNKIYSFLLGLSCIVIVALVSFKNSEKTVEKEQMIILAKGAPRSYDITICTADKYERFQSKETPELYIYSASIKKIQEYQKDGWSIISSNQANPNPVETTLYFLLEREKK